ncbi:MAG TPA: thiamine phosphate synthase [Candidatus Sulfotelmatobacter sp.]|nr:thiamine phosphate synthase [Candidatus Sulfotelmatobacter sp.]
MPANCLLYYITDRSAFPGDESARRKRLLEKISEAARADIDFIQLREKDLSARELEGLARAAIRILSQFRNERPTLRAKLLINSRTDAALAGGADGVHLRSEDVPPQAVREVWRTSGIDASQRRRQEPVIGVSCHTPEEVKRAEIEGATFAVFAPVFEKTGASPAGLDRLRSACAANIPVLALGGVTVENAQSCLNAGAAGVAGIRLFQEHAMAEIVERLRLNG